MKIVIDTHTHSVSSGHAYSTVQEMAKEAAQNGIEMFALTDHGPAMGGAPHLYHFANLWSIPSTLYGTKIIKGVEANIIDYEGNLDMPLKYLEKLEFAIASLHEICIEPSTSKDHTKALINVIKNPYIDAIAHPGNPQFEVDVEAVVKAAYEYGKLIEINDHSFLVRTGSEKNCRKFAMLCKQYKVRVLCGSDSHISFDIGKCDRVVKLLNEVEMPEELILSTSLEKFTAYLEERKERIRNHKHGSCII